MSERPLPPRLRTLPAVLLLAALLLLAGCGDDDSDPPTSGSSATTTEVTPEPGAADSELLAAETADCLEAEGLDPSVGSGEEPDAVSIDLTTQNRTIVVQIFPSEQQAAAYKSASGLDQEQVGYAVILGGLVPDATRQSIVDCLPSL